MQKSEVTTFVGRTWRGEEHFSAERAFQEVLNSNGYTDHGSGELENLQAEVSALRGALVKLFAVLPARFQAAYLETEGWKQDEMTIGETYAKE